MPGVIISSRDRLPPDREFKAALAFPAPGPLSLLCCIAVAQEQVAGTMSPFIAPGQVAPSTGSLVVAPARPRWGRF